MTNSEMMIDRLVSTAEADENLCAAAFEVIANAPAAERGALLQRFLVGFKMTPTSGALELPEIVTEHDVTHFSTEYASDADEAMLALMKQDLSEEAFYTQLWDYIASTDELPDDQTTRICALHNYAIDRRLPYYRLNVAGTVTMDEETFRATIDRIGTDAFSKMHHILYRDFSQRTQEASLLLDMLEELPDREARAVFLAQLMGFLSREARRRGKSHSDMLRMLEEARAHLPDLDDGEDDEDVEFADDADDSVDAVDPDWAPAGFDALRAINELLAHTGSDSGEAEDGDGDEAHGGALNPFGIDFGYGDLDAFLAADDGDPDGDPTVIPAED